MIDLDRHEFEILVRGAPTYRERWIPITGEHPADNPRQAARWITDAIAASGLPLACVQWRPIVAEAPVGRGNMHPGAGAAVLGPDPYVDLLIAVEVTVAGGLIAIADLPGDDARTAGWRIIPHGLAERVCIVTGAGRDATWRWLDRPGDAEVADAVLRHHTNANT